MLPGVSPRGLQLALQLGEQLSSLAFGQLFQPGHAKAHQQQLPQFFIAHIDLGFECVNRTMLRSEKMAFY